MLPALEFFLIYLEHAASHQLLYSLNHDIWAMSFFALFKVTYLKKLVAEQEKYGCPNIILSLQLAWLFI